MNWSQLSPHLIQERGITFANAQKFCFGVQSRQGKPLISLAALLPLRAQPLELQQRDRHHPKPRALIVKDGLGTSRFHEVQLRFLHPRRESFRTLGSPAARVRSDVDDLFRTTLAHSA